MKIDLKGNWKLYTYPAPLAGYDILGVVVRDDGFTGALGRAKATGIFVQINAGAIRSLDQRAVKEQLGEEQAHGEPQENG